jgi:TorA maturation chaperone TorD
LGIEQLDAAVVLEELTRPDDELAGEHLRVFGMGASDCPPYETEYHSADDTFFRTQQMADVAGFYRAFGLEHSGGSHERADHVSLELEFASFLLLKKRLARSIEPVNRAGAEQAEICHAARITFLRDHLCWWTPSFAVALDRKARGGFYSAVAQLLAALLPVERYRLGIAPPTPPIKPAVEEETSIHECGACALART